MCFGLVRITIQRRRNETATEKKRAGFEGCQRQRISRAERVGDADRSHAPGSTTIVEAANPPDCGCFCTLYEDQELSLATLPARHFRDYHLLLDEQADAIFESIDRLRAQTPFGAPLFEVSVIIGQTTDH